MKPSVRGGIWFCNRSRSGRRSGSVTDLTVTLDDPFRRGQLGQTHRPASVQLLGGDTDLGAEPELPAVGETGRGVDHDGRGINFGDPATGSATILGDDGL